ncbi:hypothetical protein [Planococcus rifietoensis]|uniref:hypothetical protein n=1 Tax=Planococcus rifietoensis TaxID=200991 RepID=UPI00384DEF17
MNVIIFLLVLATLLFVFYVLSKLPYLTMAKFTTRLFLGYIIFYLAYFIAFDFSESAANNEDFFSFFANLVTLLGLYLVLHQNLVRQVGKKNEIQQLKNAVEILQIENEVLKKGGYIDYYNH